MCFLLLFFRACVIITKYVSITNLTRCLFCFRCQQEREPPADRCEKQV